MNGQCNKNSYLTNKERLYLNDLEVDNIPNLYSMDIYREILPIKTYTVDKKFLQTIEKFINTEVPHLLNLDIQNNSEKNALFDYGVLTIHYSPTKTKTYKTINDYPYDLFLNKTKGVTLEVVYQDKQSKGLPIFVLSISLQKKKSSSRLVIGLCDEYTDMKAAAIKAGLFDVMSQKSNLNHLLYPNDIVASLLTAVALLTALLIFIVQDEAIRLYLIMSLGLNSLYLFGLKLLKGYCSFESNHQKKMDIVFKWLMGGIAAFILASTLTSIRKMIFGF